MKNETISFRLPEEEKLWLVNYAKEKDWTISKTIYNIVKEFIQKETNDK